MAETAVAPPQAETTTDSLTQVADRSRAAQVMDSRTLRRLEKVGVAEPNAGVLDQRNYELKGKRERPIRRGSPPRPEISDEDSVTITRSSLVHDVSTGESIKYDRRWRESPAKWLGITIEDRRHPETGRDVTINAEVVHKYVNFLHEYTAAWNKMSKTRLPGGGSLLDQVLADPARLADRKLVERLSVIKDGAREVVSDAQIQEFLQVGDNWGEATLAMDRFTLMNEMALGIETTVDHKIYNRQSNDRLIDGQRTITEEDLKTLRGMIGTGISNSATTIAAIGYFLGGEGRTRLTFEHRKKIIQLMKDPATGASTNDKAVILALTGVDLDQINIIGETLHGGVTHVESVKKRISALNIAKRDLQVTLGIAEPPTNRFFTKNRDVYRGRDTGRSMQEFIYLQAQGNLGGVAGRRAEGSLFETNVQVMREWGNLYRAAGGTPTEMQQLRFMEQAMTTVSTRYAQERAAREEGVKEEAKNEASLSALRQKREEIGSGEFRKNLKDAQSDRQTKAKSAREAAELKRTDLLETEGSITKEEAKLQKLEEALADLGVDITGDVSVAIDARITQLQAEIQTARTVRPSRGAANLESLFASRSADIKTAQDDIRNRWERTASATRAKGGTVGYPDADLAKEEARINAAYAARIDPLEIPYLELKRQLNELIAKKPEHQQVIRDALNATRSLAYADGERDKLQRALDAHGVLLGAAVTLPGAGGPAALTEDNINDLPSQVLVDALRGANIPPNVDDAVRLRLIYQAKAQEQLDRTPLPGYQETAIARLATLPNPFAFSADDLLIRNPAEVIRILQEQYENGGLVTDPMQPADPAANPDLPPMTREDALAQAQADVRAARLGASRQLRELTETRLTAEIEHQTAVEKDAERQVHQLDNPERLKAQMDVVIAVMEGQGETLSASRMLADRPRPGAEDRLVAFGNPAAVNAADTRLSPAEQSSGLAQGVLRWYEFLHPGYETNRYDLFEAFQQVLPPGRIAEIIDRRLGLGIGPGGGALPNVAAVMTEFTNRITGANRPNQEQLLRISEEIIAYVRAVGGAI